MRAAVEKINESRHANMIKRAAVIQAIVAEHFEPGNQSKSKSQAFRNHISKLGYSKRTFWRYMQVDTSKLNNHEDKRQLKLFE